MGGALPASYRKAAPWVVLVIYWPALFAATHLSRGQLKQLMASGHDVALHSAAYLLLTLLFWLACFGRTAPSLRNYRLYFTIALMALYGAIDEISQGWIGRTASWIDWSADVGGALGALILLRFLRNRFHWLAVYWAGLFALSIFPERQQLLEFVPRYALQFEVAIFMVAHVVLTLLWLRAYAAPGPTRVTRSAVVWTLLVLGGYVLGEQWFDAALGGQFDRALCVGNQVGVALGLVCTALFTAQTREAHDSPPDCSPR